ncbi:MAG: acyl-ACP--UDP-N-acetylglucosamine O-acyltransferase [Phycisphaeraceae bacterium]|nr:acyl-ACP--UDP-N-acetylglucosamine O-acyltransferase [Phycisphaeraceae bacterium]
MPTIHPSSVIEPGAQVADDVVIGPFCHVGPSVTLGPGCKLVGSVSILGRTRLGEANTVWPQAVLGGDPQDLKYRGEDSELIIGSHNEIRESVTIHKGTANDHNRTIVGDHNLLMAYTHIGHDCVIGSHTVIANSVQLAGHVMVEDHAAIGGATAVHHFVTIGQYAYAGGMTRVVADVAPFMVVEGNPARVRKVNTILLQRHHFDDQQIEKLKDAFRRLFRQADDAAIGNTAEALETLEADYGDDWAVKALIDAVRKSQSGVYGRYREGLRLDNRYTNPVK